MHKDTFNSNYRPEDRISSNYWDKKNINKGLKCKTTMSKQSSSILKSPILSRNYSC